MRNGVGHPSGDPADPILTDLSPRALIAAVKDNLNALNRHVRHSSATEWREEGGLYIWRTPIPHPWYSGVICSEPPGANAAAAARAAVDYFKACGVPSFAWWPVPEVDLARWAPHLLPIGFGLDPRIPGLAADLEDLPEPAPPPSVEIHRVQDEDTLRVWVRTFVAGYGVPGNWEAAVFQVYRDLLGAEAPMRFYLAYLEGAPVSTSTLFLASGVAGIYDVATLPPARGRGIGSAVTHLPLLEARGVGYRVGVLQASSKGLPVYERMGFRRVCQVEHCLWPAGAR